MKTTTAIRPALGLLLSVFLVTAAAQPRTDEHSAHHPDAAPAVESTTPEATPPAMLQSMRERMARMRESQDPQARMQLMEEQMAAMESMMQAMPAGCPMMGGMGGEGGMPKPGMGRMGGMAMPGMEGMGMHGMDMMRPHAEMMHKRVDALEKRVDLMQMMMQMQMGRPGKMGDMPVR